MVSGVCGLAVRRDAMRSNSEEARDRTGPRPGEPLRITPGRIWSRPSCRRARETPAHLAHRQRRSVVVIPTDCPGKGHPRA